MSLKCHHSQQLECRRSQSLGNFSLTSRPLQKDFPPISVVICSPRISLRIGRPYRGQRSLMYNGGWERRGLDLTSQDVHHMLVSPLFCVGLFSIKSPDLIHCSAVVCMYVCVFCFFFRTIHSVI